MWIELANGRIELVLNHDHIERLLREGGKQIPNPRKQEEPVVPPEHLKVSSTWQSPPEGKPKTGEHEDVQITSGAQPQPESEQDDGDQEQRNESDTTRPNNDRRSKRGKPAVQ